ncbi:hypothetical protein HKD37_18G050836 [Glycine soja]
MHEVSNLLDYSEPSSRAFLFENLLLLVVPTAAICSSKGMIPLETIKRDMTTLGIIAKSLVISMGTNQTGKRFYQVKVKSLDTTSIKELGRLMEPLQMQAFRKTYGKILELTLAKVSIEAIASLTQYYDQPLRCFTFGDFQLVPTIEEFEEILGCPLGGRKPYLSSGCLPSLSRIATVVKDSARGLDRIKQTRNGIAGLPQRYLEDKARGMANQGDWVPFMDVLALLIFGVVLFPNVDGLVDLAAIDAFLAYHHSKESTVVAVLADLFDTFDRRCEKSSARIICCLPALCVWLVSHLFQQDTRHPCPLLSHRSCTEKRRIDWDQLLAGIGGRTISWFPRWKEGKEGVLFSCGRYPNVPLVGTRGCINYNTALAIRQLGYPMRGAPTEESMSPFLVRDFGAQNSKTIQRIHKAWETPLRKDQELRGIHNGIIGGYHEWLKVHIRGLDWLAKLKVVSEESFEAPEEDEEVQALKSELGKAKLAKEKFKLAATHVRKECAGLREENAITARALEQETKRARKEEYGRNKFRGALWGSNSELKLRREERDQSRAHSMVLKEELIACSRSKRSLSQRLCETETNMLAIIAKYQEELGLAMAHEHRIADEYAQVYAEKEARGRVIDSLHQEATMWMDRFALTLNGSQELPRLLAKAKAMADTYSTPEEIHGLLGYCQHMIDLMAHIIRNQETQEQMKADMSALKEQMASMMEAMLSMKQLIEKNAATAAAVSSAAEADPTLLATTHHPPSNIVGRGRDTLGHDGSPHLGYNRAAYPYGLPPNYSPPVLQEDAGHIASPPDEVHKDPQDYARRDVEFYPPIPEGPAPGTLPQPNIAAPPIRWRDLAAQVAPPMVEREMITMMVDTLPVFYYEKLVGYMPSSFANLVFAGERIEVGLKRGKFDYVSSTNASTKRIGATGAKKKEGDAHAVSSTPAWVKPQQTPHGTHQYAQHHPSFSAHTGNASSSTPVQPKAPTQREAPQVPTPNTTRPAGNSNTTRNFPPRPFPEFTPLPMTYEDLLPSLIANHLAVVTPGRVLEPPFLKWYDPNATCKYHGGVPGHSVEKCLAFKYKVQHLMDVGWLTFQEDRPNVRTNPLANHGGGAVNAVESDRLHRSKPLRDVATPRRFIFEALQKGGVIPHSGCKEDSCLLHSGEMHDMETCLGVEELSQWMIDQGRLEVGIERKEEQHICMQSMEGSGVAKPKPLVIYFTKSAASQKPGHPLVAKPVPFPYQNSHAVQWRYAPPREKEEEAIDVSSLSAKVTNITGLSGVTRSGSVFAPPDLPVQPADVKGKGKVVEEQDGEAPHASNKDIPAKGPPEKKDGKKEVSLEEASEFLRIIQQSEFKVIEQVNKTPARVSLLELLMSSEPHRALLVKVLNEAHVAQDISVEGFGGLVNNITANNYLAFAEEEIPAEGRGHNKALHVSVKCMDNIVAKVLIDNGSSLNVMPKSTLEKLPFNASHLKLSSMVVRAFDGTRQEVRGEIDLPVQIGPHTCQVTFQIMDINPPYSCLLGRPWIHSVGVVPSTLHQKLKFVVEGHLVIVSGEEDILVSCPSSMPYVEAAEESLETAFQSFEVVSISSVDSLFGQPCLSDAAIMMARVMLGNGYEPGMGLGKDNDGVTSLINTQGNRGKYGLGYKPTQADMKRSIAGRKNSGQSSRWRQESEGSPPCHISRSFISAGLGDKGQVFAICEDDVPSTLDLVRPCPHDFQLGNWRVEERPGIYATSIISDDESPEGTNTWDPPIDFEQEMNQTEDEGNEDVGLRPELERMIAHEDQETGPHQEETELVP